MYDKKKYSQPEMRILYIILLRNDFHEEEKKIVSFLSCIQGFFFPSHSCDSRKKSLNLLRTVFYIFLVIKYIYT